MFNDLTWEMIVRFCRYWLFCRPSLFKLSFHNIILSVYIGGTIFVHLICLLFLSFMLPCILGRRLGAHSDLLPHWSPPCLKHNTYLPHVRIIVISFDFTCVHCSAFERTKLCPPWYHSFCAENSIVYGTDKQCLKNWHT